MLRIFICEVPVTLQLKSSLVPELEQVIPASLIVGLAGFVRVVSSQTPLLGIFPKGHPSQEPLLPTISP